MPDFQNASFVPFEHYVNRARSAQRQRIDFSRGGKRRIDFTDAVIVSEIRIEDAPEFADTIPDCLPDFEPTMPMPVPEVQHVQVDIAVTSDVIGTADVIANKLARAQNFIAARAFTECLHAGFFPPKYQACGR